MEVRIKETGVVENLSYTDIKTGVNFIKDLIGNHDGFGTEDHQFLYDSETDSYTASQDTFEWWKKVAGDNEELDERIAALSEIHGSEVVSDALQAAGSYDLEDHAAALNRVLDETFDE
ncbi:hypothetical protein ACFOQM_23365 [Paenibacillus sp. GCM10012307]|uniref:Uncharacterized protein n=1 Tax=Paenibacillus roseus TaxID=2798579 RepID=A0A934MTF0_9BACL|nr:hypothetical protein [Paenibacillus roseus]MBJ6364164.1 hypothetical protein [Paenibacillus roseus]